MKQTAASAATRNASRSFRSMARLGLATDLGTCCKLPPISVAFRSKLRREESTARPDRAFHPVNPGKVAISRRPRVGRYGDDLATLRVHPCAASLSSLLRHWFLQDLQSPGQTV